MADTPAQAWKDWLDTATSGIRFGPDRRAAEEELLGHLEDKQAALLRRYPDLSAETAEEMALARMGDPEEIGKALAKIHRPWLGWLWTASRWAVGLLLAGLTLFLVFSHDHFESRGGTEVWGSYRSGGYTQPLEAQPAQVSLGGYTFRIVEAVYAGYPEDSDRPDQIQVTFRVSSPRFWARINNYAVQRALTVETQDGTRWPVRGENWPVRSVSQVRWGLFFREYTAYVETRGQKGDRILLDFDFGKGRFTLSALLTEQEAEP